METSMPVHVGPRDIPGFDLRIRLSRTRPDVAEDVARLTGVSVAMLETDGMERHVRTLVSGDGPVAIDHVADHHELTICPIAYRLSRGVGFDPVAIHALASVGTYVHVVHPWWKAPTVVMRRGRHLAFRVPVAPGVTWYASSGTTGWLLLDPEMAGISIMEAVAAYADMAGRKVSEVVSHPMLDKLDMRFTRTTAPAWNLLSAHTDRAPVPIPIGEALELRGGGAKGRDGKGERG